MSDCFNFEDLPKAELHAHLNGCVPPAVVHRLIKQYEVPLPAGYNLPDDLMIKKPVATLLDYFRPWFVFKLLPIGQDCLNEMFLSAAEKLASDGVRYAELRNSPYNIADINNISLEYALQWLIEASTRASEAHNIDLRLIVSLSRYKFNLEQANLLLSAIATVSHSRRIVAIDLSGDEDDPISPEITKLFQIAKYELGLGITVHAGETCNADNVRWAVENCHADRIGHGLAASTDSRVLELLLSKNVCVEMCLQSNLMTGRISSLEYHPVHSFIEASIPFVLCTDNPQVHGVKLSDEYQLFTNTTGRIDYIKNMYETQLKYAFGKRG